MHDINSLSASILICLIVLVLIAPRRWALLAMAGGVLYLTQYVWTDVMGLHMFPIRFLEIAGFVRVMVRREFVFADLNELDRWFLLFYSYTLIVYLLRSTEGQMFQIGLAVDASLCYFTFRGLIADFDDFRWFLKGFALLLIPYIAILIVEMRTGHDPFALLGGGKIAEAFREGRTRCHGSFRHPSLLGGIGGCFLPLYISMLMVKKDRFWGITGILACLALVLLANSGGPVAEVAVGLACWLLWPMRTKMRHIRNGMLAAFALVAVVMKAPVWYLPARVSGLLGIAGDSWHRSRLLQLAAGSFGKWWLWGMDSARTIDWFPYRLAANIDATDITNQFLAIGLAGGLLAIVLFVWLLVKCFKIIGRAMRAVRLLSDAPSEMEFLLWGLGAVLVVNIENWFAITYFDQSYVIWFMQLAAIVNMSQICLQACRRQGELWLAPLGGRGHGQRCQSRVDSLGFGK